jgi:hypothetical protein
MDSGLRCPDGEVVRNSRHLSPKGVELSRRPGAAKGTAIVRAGHPALDAALTSDAHRRYSARTVNAMQEATRVQTPARPVVAEAPATTLGRVAEQFSVTTDRQTGTVTTIHTAVTRSVLSRGGSRFQLRVWRELAQQSWN